MSQALLQRIKLIEDRLAKLEVYESPLYKGDVKQSKTPFDNIEKAAKRTRKTLTLDH